MATRWLAWGGVMLSSVAHARPHRMPPTRASALAPEPGRATDLLVVKLAEDAGFEVVDGRVVTAPAGTDELVTMLSGAQARFRRPSKELGRFAESVDPEGVLADLNLYLELRGDDLLSRGLALLDSPHVETVFFPLLPTQPPSSDVPPETPDLFATQGYFGSAPDGMGWAEVAAWPGGRGGEVAVADVEYGWNPFHEDLIQSVPEVPDWGWDSGAYPCHGTLVLGMLVGGDNGFGVKGLVPETRVHMISPYDDNEVYNVAAAIDGAAAMLLPGDVILIEQQAYANGRYAPVEVSPDVWDAISLAVAAGLVVVEAGGNGAADLDAPVWDDWFNRDVRDSGAIMVGGGAWPGSGFPERSWLTGGSSFGSRVDLQGWYGGIATTAYDPSLDPYCSYPDLFFADVDQAYTSGFGGTSGASPMVAAAASVANGVRLATRGVPWDPMDLRAALIETGTPQQGSENIGPQVNMREFLRVWGWR